MDPYHTEARGEQANVLITVTNPLFHPAKLVHLALSCACTSGAIDHESLIPAAGSVSIPITVTTKGRHGPFTVWATPVFENEEGRIDGEHIQINVSVEDLFTVMPAVTTFVTSPQREPLHVHRTIRYSKGTGFRITSSSDRINAAIIAGSDPHEANLDVDIGAFPPGIHGIHVEIACAEGTTYRLDWILHVIHPWFAEATIPFGATTVGRTVTRSLSLNADAPGDLEIETAHFDGPIELPISVRTIREGTGRRLHCELRPEKDGMFRGDLVLRCRSSTGEVNVRLPMSVLVFPSSPP